MKLIKGSTEETDHMFFLCDSDGTFMMCIDKIANTDGFLSFTYKDKIRGSSYPNGSAVILHQAKELGIEVEEVES